MQPSRRVCRRGRHGMKRMEGGLQGGSGKERGRAEGQTRNERSDGKCRRKGSGAVHAFRARDASLARVSLRVSRPRSGSPSLLSSLTSRAPPGDTAWAAMDTHGGHPLRVLRPPVCQTSKTPVSFPNKLPGAPLSTTSPSSSPASSSLYPPPLFPASYSPYS